MVEIVSDDKDLEGLKKAVYTILEDNILLTLATGDKAPYVNCAYYVFDDDFNLFIWTSPKSHHGKLLKDNNQVSVSIADSTQAWGSVLKGLQITGVCERLSLPKMLKPANMYFKRFPLVKKRIANWKEFNSKYESRIFKIQIDWIKIFDKERYGDEEWEEVKIIR